jgi:hypothetical protein
MALNRALLHLDGADEAADAAKVRLQKQNERLEGLGENMKNIHENLDDAEDEITGLESTFGLELGGWLDDQLSDVKCCSCLGGRKLPSLVGKIEPGGELVKQGWLRKRGKGESFGWKKRWVLLYPNAVFFYEDQEHFKKKGAVRLTTATEIWSFHSYDAPGDAVKHRGAKPNGFLIKIPRAGLKSAFHYWEAKTPQDTKDWIQEFERVVKQIDPDEAGSHPGSPTLGSEKVAGDQPLEMELINDKLDGLMAKAEGLGEDAKKQKGLVQGVADQVDSATDRIVTADARLRKHINE